MLMITKIVEVAESDVTLKMELFRSHAEMWTKNNPER